MLKRLMLLYLLIAFLPCAALAAPWVEETEYDTDGSLLWRATCFADELPPLLQGVVRERSISGASVELPAQQLALAVLTAADGRVLAYVQQEGTWAFADLSGTVSGSVGLHDREGSYPVFCVFNAYRSQKPTWHVEYVGDAFQLTPWSPEEHELLTMQ